MTSDTNRQWVLASRPAGRPQMENFDLVERSIPEPGLDQVLVRTRYMSVDPYMRGRMRAEGSYTDSWSLGEPMKARVVGEVVESNDDDFSSGDTVFGHLHWAEYAAVYGSELQHIDYPDVPDSTTLHVLGMPGRTAYIGLVEVGHVKPGDTVVISAAAGAVGSVAGQIAQIAGCNVVGVAGTEEKIEWITNDLGFDDAINYRTTDNLSAAVADACPNGVDLYFENVGGPVTDAVFDHLNDHSRVPVCGKISLYNSEPGDPKMIGPRLLHQRTQTREEGFIISHYEHLYEETSERLRRWVRDGEVRYRETITEGIEAAPEAFLDLFEGNNIGKQLVRMDP